MTFRLMTHTRNHRTRTRTRWYMQRRQHLLKAARPALSALW